MTNGKRWVRAGVGAVVVVTALASASGCNHKPPPGEAAPGNEPLASEPPPDPVPTPLTPEELKQAYGELETILDSTDRSKRTAELVGVIGRLGRENLKAFLAQLATRRANYLQGIDKAFGNGLKAQNYQAVA